MNLSRQHLRKALIGLGLILGMTLNVWAIRGEPAPYWLTALATLNGILLLAWLISLTHKVSMPKPREDTSWSNVYDYNPKIWVGYKHGNPKYLKSKYTDEE